MNILASKISDSEVEIMKVLWDAEDAMSLADIRKTLNQYSRWDDSTIKTLLRRLHTKGVINQEKHNVFYYSPCVTKDEYETFCTQSLIDRLYKGSAFNLVASLVKGNELTADDIDELRSILKSEDEHE